MELAGNFKMTPFKGFVLLEDVENEFIHETETSKNEIVKPNNTAYELKSEGSGQIVEMAKMIRFGRVVEISDSGEHQVEIGDYVFYHVHSATLIPIGPNNTVIRVAELSLLSIVRPN